jgi:predicted nucleic-acid-binding Zn-ribbon protein
MPPNHFVLCPHCGKENVYDEMKLRAEGTGARIFRMRRPKEAQETHEFAVTCKHCTRGFKLKIPVSEGG